MFSPILTTPDFDHFNIYVTTSAGRTLVGQTRDEAFYIPTFTRNANDASLSVELVPVMKDLKEGEAKVLTADYPQDGLKVADGSSLTSNPIKVQATAAGRQTVTVKATNAIGTSSTTFQAIDVMANDAEIAEVTNVILGKTVVDFSGSTNNKETPGKIIDGITNPTSTSEKWCNVSPENWVIFDCEGVYRFYGFRIYDCKSGPEQNENVRDYTIELSVDGKVWTTVVDEKDRSDDNIKTDYIAPVQGRYIRFAPKVEGTLRIWEFEAYGADDQHMTIAATPAEMRIDAGTTETIQISCQFNGDETGDDFRCTAKSSSSVVSIGQIEGNYEKTGFTIPVTASNQIGESTITIRVTNNGAYRETKVKVIVDAPDGVNVLSGAEAQLRHYTESDFAYDAEYTSSATQIFLVKDMENPSDDASVSNVGRLSYQNETAPDENRFFDKVPFCSLYEVTVPADKTKKAIGLSVGFSDFDAISCRATILGVAKTKEGSGIENLLPADTTGKSISGIYNLRGQ